jgi:hypothetical protein
MLAEPVVQVDLESVGVAADQPTRARLDRLQAAVAEAVSQACDVMETTVVEGCGEFEVRVGGPSRRLRLFFDSAADVALVRSTVCRAVDRYGLGSSAAQEARSKGREN